ncbi:MAG: NAD(P)-dependent oxidoreductase [Bacteroidales bacterium]|nr:NAD(P)-dependent oxidoreductase [Bacteroidales bacterium]
MGKTIIVFGATGKVGCYTSIYLKEKGYNVIAVGRRKSDNDFFADYKITYISLDILKSANYEVLPQKDVYGIVHLAATLPATMNGYNPHEYVRSNLDGTLNVLDYAVKVGVNRFVYPKSWSDITYMIGSLNPIPADAPVKFPLDNDHTIYAITKNAACDIIQHYSVKYKFKYYILRFPNIFCYHPNPTYFVDGKKRWTGQRAIIEQAKKGEDIELWGNPNAARDVFYVKDCTQIIEKCLSANGESGTYNVGTGWVVTRREQIQGLIDIFGDKMHPSKIVVRSDKPDSPTYLLDISKTIGQLGFEPKYDYITYLKDLKHEMEINRFEKLWGKESDYLEGLE